MTALYTPLYPISLYSPLSPISLSLYSPLYTLSLSLQEETQPLLILVPLRQVAQQLLHLLSLEVLQHGLHIDHVFQVLHLQ